MGEHHTAIVFPARWRLWTRMGAYHTYLSQSWNLPGENNLLIYWFLSFPWNSAIFADFHPVSFVIFSFIFSLTRSTLLRYGHVREPFQLDRESAISSMSSLSSRTDFRYPIFKKELIENFYANYKGEDVNNHSTKTFSFVSFFFAFSHVK
jgi:hypothetical protein